MSLCLKGKNPFETMDDIFSLDSSRLIKQQSAPGTPKFIDPKPSLRSLVKQIIDYVLCLQIIIDSDFWRSQYRLSVLLASDTVFVK